MKTDKRTITLAAIAAAVFIAAAIAAICINRQTADADTVQIYVNGELRAEFPADADETYIIYDEDTGEAMNTVRISDGEVWMESATCPDKLCVNQGKIHNSAAPIICLPHKVEVRMTTGTDVDAVSG